MRRPPIMRGTLGEALNPPPRPCMLGRPLVRRLVIFIRAFIPPGPIPPPPGPGGGPDLP